jgi:hypothetical protein
MVRLKFRQVGIAPTIFKANVEITILGPVATGAQVGRNAGRSIFGPQP